MFILLSSPNQTPLPRKSPFHRVFSFGIPRGHSDFLLCMGHLEIVAVEACSEAVTNKSQ